MPATELAVNSPPRNSSKKWLCLTRQRLHIAPKTVASAWMVPMLPRDVSCPSDMLIVFSRKENGGSLPMYTVKFKKIMLDRNLG